MLEGMKWQHYKLPKAQSSRILHRSSRLKHASELDVESGSMLSELQGRFFRFEMIGKEVDSCRMSECGTCNDDR